MVRMAFALCLAFALAGCSGADDPSPGQAAGGGNDDHYGWPSGDNRSDMDDGSYWPRWKNPCPGPACDPYRGVHPEWLVDPPPDREVTEPGEPVTQEHLSAPELAPQQSKTK